MKIMLTYNAKNKTRFVHKKGESFQVAFIASRQLLRLRTLGRLRHRWPSPRLVWK